MYFVGLVRDIVGSKYARPPICNAGVVNNVCLLQFGAQTMDNRQTDYVLLQLKQYEYSVTTNAEYFLFRPQAGGWSMSA